MRTSHDFPLNSLQVHLSLHLGLSPFDILQSLLFIDITKAFLPYEMTRIGLILYLKLLTSFSPANFLFDYVQPMTMLLAVDDPAEVIYLQQGTFGQHHQNNFRDIKTACAIYNLPDQSPTDASALWLIQSSFSYLHLSRHCILEVPVNTKIEGQILSLSPSKIPPSFWSWKALS